MARLAYGCGSHGGPPRGSPQDTARLRSGLGSPATGPAIDRIRSPRLWLRLALPRRRSNGGLANTLLSEVGDAGSHLLHQETQALVVPSRIVRVRRDRQQRAE